MWVHHEQLSTQFSLDKIRSPLAMHVVMQECSDYVYNSELGYYECVPVEPSPAAQAFEEFVGKLGDAVISYGYNP